MKILKDPPARATEALYELWNDPRTTKSDFARDYANEIAWLASNGLITIMSARFRSRYSFTWKVTSDGLRYLEKQRA